MKQTMKILLLMAVALLATACEMDKLNPSNPEENSELGYLMIGQVSTNADTEVGELNGSTDAASRAVTTAPDSYYLEIVNSTTSATVWSGTIAQLNAYTEGPPALLHRCKYQTSPPGNRHYRSSRGLWSSHRTRQLHQDR